MYEAMRFLIMNTPGRLLLKSSSRRGGGGSSCSQQILTRGRSHETIQLEMGLVTIDKEDGVTRLQTRTHDDGRGLARYTFYASVNRKILKQCPRTKCC